MSTSSSYKDLFRTPTTEDKLSLFQKLLDAREDMTVDLALALLKVIHEELSSDQSDDRSVYKRYAKEIESLRFRIPGALQQVVGNWNKQRGGSPPEWFTYRRDNGNDNDDDNENE